MTVMRFPVSSQEARELAERREAFEADRRQREQDHARRCVRGWLDDPDADRPRPCPQCRPHLLAAPCRTCGILAELCDRQVDRGHGRCCTACEHTTRGSA